MQKNRSTKAMDANKKKIILTGLGIAGVGLAGYFSWQYFSRRKNEEPTADQTPIPNVKQLPSKAPVAKPKPKVASSDNFPLKKGSRGARVKTLQLALLSKYGNVLPRYGADGGFGTELMAALKKLNLPSQINEKTFKVLTEGSAPDPRKLADGIFKAADSRNFSQTLSLLKQVRSKEEYNSVSNIFKNYRIRGGVRQTLVNGVLNSFTSAAQKDQLKLEFSRMGLNYDKGKWSLAGTESPALITAKPTWVWKSKTEYVKVPKGMVLGRYVKKEKKFITFENAGKVFLVRASDVTRL